MATPDDGAEVLRVLEGYFSAPIARALLGVALRRASSDGAPSPVALAHAIRAVEQMLPAYMADASRRDECLARVRALAPARLPVAVGVPTTLGASTVVHVASADDVMNASEVGRDIAKRVGFPNVAQTKIATAVAELARNILLYARIGEVRLASVEAPRRGVEVAASDRGPGIADMNLVLNGDYRSKTGMGMGLRGARRLMDTFEIASSPKGTHVVARKYLS